MYGDLSTWLSLPDEGTLPTRKFIGDDDAIVFSKAKSCLRVKSNALKPVLVTLVTDSANLLSSSDTLNYHEKKVEVDSDLENSFDFDHQHSAFSYYSESTDLATSESLEKITRGTAERIRKKSATKKSLSTRKCVSCPEAARLSLSDQSVCSSVFTRKGSRVSRSLEATLLDTYQHEGQWHYDLDTGTTTLDVAADFEEVGDEYHDAINYASASNSTKDNTSTTSSIAFFTEEDAADYEDDNCSRVSYVSLFRASPVPFESETATDETAASLNILSDESVRLTYITPAPSPYRIKQRRALQRGCKTCTLDGLKFHPACPASEPRRTSKGSMDASMQASIGELNIIYD